MIGWMTWQPMNFHLAKRRQIRHISNHLIGLNWKLIRWPQKILSLIKNCQAQTVLPIERLYISGTTWTKASQLAEALQAKLDILCLPMHPKYAVNHAIEDNDMEQAPMLTAAAALALTRSGGLIFCHGVKSVAVKLMLSFVKYLCRWWGLLFW